MVRTPDASNVIDLAEERARRRRNAGASISTSFFEISIRGILLWATYWRWALSSFQREN